MTQQFLNLTADEVLVLCDRVRNDDTGTEDMRCSAYALLLRLGSAYVEMLGETKQDGTIPIAVSEAETWLLRSKVTSGDKMGSDPLFGIKLLQKLYRVLLAYNTESAGVPDGPADEDVKLSPFSKRALGEWVDRHKGDES